MQKCAFAKTLAKNTKFAQKGFLCVLCVFALMVFAMEVKHRILD